MDDREKLKHLLGHWIEHNEEHALEFRQWAEKAKELGEPEMHNKIQEAVAQLQKANASLNKALEQLPKS